ncbi:hypothetical protein EVAR_6179_1 [Eumeta japonica]|uniref:Uncharacterized protein n=1 Tax=Eumeta variegata TaxID=151549 RepID=A0A4C1TH19_EUMVA|nr:hypothetical protein EVAR_6179_1 [Eumeta japonica]
MYAVAVYSVQMVTNFGANYRTYSDMSSAMSTAAGKLERRTRRSAASRRRVTGGARVVGQNAVACQQQIWYEKMNASAQRVADDLEDKGSDLKKRQN